MKDNPQSQDQKLNPGDKKKGVNLKEELHRRYDAASLIGRQILNINEVRLQGKFTYALNQEKFPKSYLASLASKGPEDNITEEEIVQARRGSFAIALESARQIKEGDVIRQKSSAKDEPGNLSGLATVLQSGKNLAEQMVSDDPQGIFIVAKEIIGIQLGKKAEEITMPEPQIQDWIIGNFTGAIGKLGRQKQALDAYLNTRF